MSTKSAPWPKWPFQWLKRLPNPYDGAAVEPVSTFEIVTPASQKEKPGKPQNAPSGVVFHFEDFVERPLRSTPPSRRATSESDGGDGDPGRGGLDGALGGSPGPSADHGNRPSVAPGAEPDRS